jgi:hypothetical protein
VVELPPEDESVDESSTGGGTYPSDEELYVFYGVGDPSDFEHIEILVDEYEMDLALQALEGDERVFADDPPRSGNEEGPNEHVFVEDPMDERATTRQNEHVFAMMEGEGAPRAEIVKSSPASKG